MQLLVKYSCKKILIKIGEKENWTGKLSIKFPLSDQFELICQAVENKAERVGKMLSKMLRFKV